MPRAPRLKHAVTFAPLDEEEIEAYVASGEPSDKAGAYAIQGLAGRYIPRIEGCYFNVVGLPLARLYALLRELGWQRTKSNRQTKRAVPWTALSHESSTDQISEELLLFLGCRRGRRRGGRLTLVLSAPGRCPAPCMPSLKLRIPSPKPRMTSGIFLPPNNSTIMARTTSQ